MEIKEAIRVAFDAVKEMFGGSRDHRLEEVEVRDDGGADVTVSFRTDEAPMIQPLGIGPGSSSVQPRRAALGVDASRLYKTVDVNPDGRVRAVRIRQIVLG